jgi:hypothetical protein
MERDAIQEGQNSPSPKRQKLDEITPEKNSVVADEVSSCDEEPSQAPAAEPVDSAPVGQTDVVEKPKGKIRKRALPVVDTKEYQNKFEQLNSVVNSIQADILLVYAGNKAAVDRVRKGEMPWFSFFSLLQRANAN